MWMYRQVQDPSSPKPFLYPSTFLRGLVRRALDLDLAPSPHGYLGLSADRLTIGKRKWLIIILPLKLPIGAYRIIGQKKHVNV